MRVTNAMRYLLVAAAVMATSTRAADSDAGIVSAADSTADTISVSAMAATSPISFLTPTATTATEVLTPASTKNATTPSATLAPSATTAPSATSAPLTPATGSSDGASPATVGAPITCAFRYSLPTTSNLADELAALKKAKKNAASSTSGGSGTSANSSAGSGASDQASTSNGTATEPTTTGSGAGETLPSAGSSDAGTTTVTKTPSPSVTTKTPSTTVSPTTKTPVTTTKTPTTTTKAPSNGGGAGSTDGTSLRRLQTDAGDVASPTPTPTTKKPSATTVSPTTKKTTAPPSSATDGSTTGASPTQAPAPAMSGTSSSDSSGAAETTAPTPTASNSTSDGSASAATTVVTGEFTCDASFYGAWSKLGLTCGGVNLDVASAVAQSQCLIYSGVQSTSVLDIKMCMSVCKFPKCSNRTWDYTAEDGFTSDIYTKLNFVELLTAVGKSDLVDSTASSVLSQLSFQTDRECSYTDESSFKTCQCENLLVSGSSNSTSKTPTPAALTPVKDKGLADADHWADGLPKSSFDKAGIASAAVGTSAAAVSVAAGAVMSVAGSIMGTGAGVAGGVSATASLGLAMVAVDMCQFGVMVNQMNLDASPRMLQEMGKRMAPAAFSFLPFGKVENDTSGNSTSTTSRRLMDVTNTNQTLGMERYADLIGVKVDMLFYLTLAGVMVMCVAPFVLCAVFVVCAAPFVSSFKDFSRKWFDKAVGVLMMILILSEYVVGVTATFQICYLIKYDKVDIGIFLAIFALVFFAVGTILYGVWVVRRHEDELRDLGTKDHFEKPVHARYGPLYDEYKFEGRYFFAPKLLLALMCGVTTGFIGMPGIWQVIVLITLHIAFLLYMEVKRPFPTAFVQKTSSFVIIIKISGLFLTLFLISSATSLQGDIPVDLREGVGFAIIGLQVLVLLCLMVRQVYIFYITWKLKRQEDENKEMAEQQYMTNSFNPLGSNINGLVGQQSRHNQGHLPNQRQYENQNHQPHGHDQFAILDGGRASTPLQPQYGGNTTPNQYKQQQGGRLPGLQPAPLPAQGMRRTHTVVHHDDPTPNNNYRRHNEISL